MSLPPMNGGLPTINSAAGHSGGADSDRPPCPRRTAERIAVPGQHRVLALDILKRPQDRLGRRRSLSAEMPLQIADPEHQFGDCRGAGIDLQPEELVWVNGVALKPEHAPGRPDRRGPPAPRPPAASSTPARHRGSCRCRRRDRERASRRGVVEFLHGVDRRILAAFCFLRSAVACTFPHSSRSGSMMVATTSRST